MRKQYFWYYKIESLLPYLAAGQAMLEIIKLWVNKLIMRILTSTETVSVCKSKPGSTPVKRREKMYGGPAEI